MVRNEFSATEVRKLLQELFPLRRLVLSQFTFFNQTGVACPTGETFRRKRRCYRIIDVLPIAVVLALKEQGIPLKNISQVPQLMQRHASDIFRLGRGCRLYGLGERVSLQLPGAGTANTALMALLGDHLAGEHVLPEQRVPEHHTAAQHCNADHLVSGDRDGGVRGNGSASAGVSGMSLMLAAPQESESAISCTSSAVAHGIFWGFDVGDLAEQICAAASRVYLSTVAKAEAQRAA